LKLEAGLVQSRSYNIVTYACQVSDNLSKYLMQNCSFYFVPVQLFIFVSFYCCTDLSFVQGRSNLFFFAFSIVWEFKISRDIYFQIAFARTLTILWNQDFVKPYLKCNLYCDYTLFVN